MDTPHVSGHGYRYFQKYLYTGTDILSFLKMYPDTVTETFRVSMGTTLNTFFRKMLVKTYFIPERT